MAGRVKLNRSSSMWNEEKNTCIQLISSAFISFECKLVVRRAGSRYWSAVVNNIRMRDRRATRGAYSRTRGAEVLFDGEHSRNIFPHGMSLKSSFSCKLLQVSKSVLNLEKKNSKIDMFMF